MKAMVLAAGRGVRMGHLTSHKPKPLLEINGKKLIEIQLNKLIDAGFNDFLINVSYLHDQIIHFVETRFSEHAKINFSIEKDPLETAGGILNAINYFDQNPFLVTNADIHTDFDYKNLFDYELSDKNESHLILVNNPEFKKKGDFGLKNAMVDLNKDYTYSGIGIFKKKFFEGFMAGEKIKLKDVIDKGISKKTVSGSVYDGYWSDIGTTERLEQANKRSSKN